MSMTAKTTARAVNRRSPVEKDAAHLFHPVADVCAGAARHHLCFHL